MTDRNKKRKFEHLESYIGLTLSLIFISVILVNNLIIKERYISITYLDKHLEFDHYLYKELVPARRNYNTLTLRGESDSAINEIKKIVISIYNLKDTLNGVKIIFDKSIKYRQYIKTINILISAEAKTFIPQEDTIFVYYLNRNRQDDDLESNIPRYKIFPRGIHIE